jgi:hypothetical protein
VPKVYRPSRLPLYLPLAGAGVLLFGGGVSAAMGGGVPVGAFALAGVLSAIDAVLWGIWRRGETRVILSDEGIRVERPGRVEELAWREVLRVREEADSDDLVLLLQGRAGTLVRVSERSVSNYGRLKDDVVGHLPPTSRIEL